jgi:RNA polymerase sigma factor (TIGR02999 family)
MWYIVILELHKTHTRRPRRKNRPDRDPPQDWRAASVSTGIDEPIARTLSAAAGGDPGVAADLLPLVYTQLRALARAQLMRLPPGQTLQPTALVHEAYLRVAGRRDLSWDDRGHFFAAAAKAMRDILVDEARRKMAKKRGGGQSRIAIEQAEMAFSLPSEDVLAVDEALGQLERDDPRKGQIVNLRFFARLTVDETAAALGISPTTVRREWRYIRAWLGARLETDHSR